MIRLGVNIDHVATLRNARDEFYPDPVYAAIVAEQAGASNITCHLREDRRHIKDRDVFRIKDSISIPLNFEIAATEEMIQIALKLGPTAVTLVPEKRQEKTTESGLHFGKDSFLQSCVERLKSKGIVVSLFVESDESSLVSSKELGADAIEIHTGPFCQQFAQAKSLQQKSTVINVLKKSAAIGHNLGLQVHYGHGLNYQNANWLQLIPHCEEANIGHSIIAKSLFIGLDSAIKEMYDLLNNPVYRPHVD